MNYTLERTAGEDDNRAFRPSRNANVSKMRHIKHRTADNTGMQAIIRAIMYQ